MGNLASGSGSNEPDKDETRQQRMVRMNPHLFDPRFLFLDMDDSALDPLCIPEDAAKALGEIAWSISNTMKRDSPMYIDPDIIGNLSYERIELVLMCGYDTLVARVPALRKSEFKRDLYRALARWYDVDSQTRARFKSWCLAESRISGLAASWVGDTRELDNLAVIQEEYWDEHIDFTRCMAMTNLPRLIDTMERRDARGDPGADVMRVFFEGQYNSLQGLVLEKVTQPRWDFSDTEMWKVYRKAGQRLAQPI